MFPRNAMQFALFLSNTGTVFKNCLIVNAAFTNYYQNTSFQINKETFIRPIISCSNWMVTQFVEQVNSTAVHNLSVLHFYQCSRGLHAPTKRVYLSSLRLLLLSLVISQHFEYPVDNIIYSVEPIKFISSFI
jgi:hypothetical protein